MRRLVMKNKTMHMIWLIIVIILLLAVSSGEPKTIDNLAVSDSTFHSVTLKWTSPGVAPFYDIRYSTSILNIDSWNLACQVLGEPTPGETGTSQYMTFSGLLPNTNYNFAIKSCDSDTNCSDLSNVASITTDNDNFIRYIIYENGEDGTIKRWSKPSWPPGITVENVDDEKRQSRVIKFQGYGTNSKYRLHLEDGNTWNINTSQFENIVVKWSMRYSEDFFVYFYVETDCKVDKMVYLLFDTFKKYLEEEDNAWDWELLNILITEKPPYCLRGLYVYHFLGPEALDGEWHTFVRDLQADLEDIKPLKKILKVNEFVISGSGRVDDIMFGKAVNTGDDTIPPVPPSNLTAKVISSSEIELSWDVSIDNIGVTEYRIYRGGLEIGMSTIPAYADKELAPSTTYTYKVVASDEAGNLSENSSEISKKTLEQALNVEEGEGGENEVVVEGKEEEQGSKEIGCFIMTTADKEYSEKLFINKTLQNIWPCSSHFNQDCISQVPFSPFIF